jgi:DNA-binding NarL/FixJ family response regulator
MSARLDLFISGKSSPCEEPIEFFAEQDWNQETELKLLSILREVLAMLRPASESLSLDLIVRAADPEGLKILLRRKLNKGAPVQHQKLSCREMEIFSLIIQGCTNKMIAHKLFISYETVKSHRKNILLKMGASNTAMLINYYHQTFFDKK